MNSQRSASNTPHHIGANEKDFSIMRNRKKERKIERRRRRHTYVSIRLKHKAATDIITI